MSLSLSLAVVPTTTIATATTTAATMVNIAVAIAVVAGIALTSPCIPVERFSGERVHSTSVINQRKRGGGGVRKGGVRGVFVVMMVDGW